MAVSMYRAQTVAKDNIGSELQQALAAGNGVLRLLPNWVPRNFLQPGRRIKLNPNDWYALGLNRGGIDERWFGSTTDAMNDNRLEDEGQSYVGFNGKKFQLRHAVEEDGATTIGAAMWDKYHRWPCYSKFFDNAGPIPHHMHQMEKDAKNTGQEGKPESYYFPPQLNAAFNNFDYTFFGLTPDTKKADVYKCLEDWNKGDNGILDLSVAHRLQRGTGWSVPAGVLHAPGSLCTYEPQWGSDVFGMYQSIVEGREVPWDLLVKDVPEDKKFDLDYIVEQLDWDKNVDPNFKERFFMKPVVDETQSGEGFSDKWIDYKLFDGKQMVTAKELTVMPGSRCTLKDGAASCWIFVQGSGKINSLDVQTPVMIDFGAETADEFFVTYKAACEGVTVVNDGYEPLVALRYFGPDSFDNSRLPK